MASLMPTRYALDTNTWEGPTATALQVPRTRQWPKQIGPDLAS